MNEKIRELMMKATKDMPETYYWPGEYVEKFAELILKEAMLVCRTEWVSDSSAQKYGNQCADSIKQHFGVEE